MEVEAYRREVFIIEWTSLPQEQRDYVKDMLDHWFANDILIKWPTELAPSDGGSYEDSMTMQQVRNYWREQCVCNGYKDELENFVEDYGLKFEVWMIEQRFDFSGVKDIYIKVCW